MKTGFSLAELVVSIGIFVIIMGFTVVNLRGGSSGQQLRLQTQNVASLLGQAQSLSTSGIAFNGQVPLGGYGVFVSQCLTSPCEVVLFADLNNNFKYDSSIFPFKFPSFLKLIFGKNVYGNNLNLYVPYKINFKDLTEDTNSNLWELPISIFHLGKIKLPLTGGIYVRMIPWFIFKFLLNWKLKKELACVHFHTFDFAEKKPEIKMPKIKKFIKYYNTKNSYKKLEYILKKYKCASIENYLKTV